MKQSILITSLCLLCMGCSPEQKNFPKHISGLWEMQSFEVEIPAENDSDDAEVIRIEPGQWQQKLELLPTRIHWRDHNHYESLTLRTDSSVAEKRIGIWKYEADSVLVMIEPQGTIRYTINWKTKDRLNLSAQIDWDNDGLRNEKFAGWYERIPAPVLSVEAADK